MISETMQVATFTGLLFAFIAFALAFAISFAMRKGDGRFYFAAAIFGLILGWAVALMAPERGTITRTYHYFSHINWTWIICVPVLVVGGLTAYWMRLRFGRVEHLEREIRRLREDARRRLPPPSQSKLIGWRPGDE